MSALIEARARTRRFIALGLAVTTAAGTPIGAVALASRVVIKASHRLVEIAEELWRVRSRAPFPPAADGRDGKLAPEPGCRRG